ncbi:XdhC family protein [Paraflavitalea speifideaquila]|uniref:XdhC family protein n=1 Tax=Paraflavitalea speifideaquila TaxID=3076558 RepID=UPI0028F07453|nr:XdhC family protein [Paraflavitalea speifideiaquila]
MKEIEDIIGAYQKATVAGKQTALATVVHVEGSSYRRPGARMLVTADGELTGAISGGCLEGDALRKALLAISQQKNKLVTYDTTDEDDLQFGVQLGCSGIVHILFEPIDASLPLHPISLLEKAMATGKETVIVTLFSLRAYDGIQPGTCLLHTEAATYSRITDTALENDIHRGIQEALHSDTSLLREYTPGPVPITALIEWLQPPPSLVVAGAGNDAIPLVKMAHIAGWHITVADGRPSQANRRRFPEARHIIADKPPAVIAQLKTNPQTAFVLMTHNYNYDKEMLQLLLQRSCSYIGVLGPGRKLERMLQEITAATGQPIEAATKSHLYGPTGLDIGAETAEEIALSVMAEIKMVLAGKKGQSLRDKKGSIHEHEHVIIRDETPRPSNTAVSCTITDQLNNPTEI